MAVRTARDLADLAELAGDLADLAAIDPVSLSREGHAELLVRMAGLHDQCTRITGSLADVSDTIAAPCAVGEKSVTALLRARSRIERRQTRRFLTAGRARYRFPTFHAAHRSARVTVGHLELMADLAKRANSHQLQAAEPFLCAVAVASTVEEFAKACAEWEAMADPSEHLHDYLKSQARRHLLFSPDLFGNLHFTGTADPLQGESLVEILNDKVDELFRADQTQAAETGRPIARDNPQRRLDALIDLLELGAGAGAGGRKPAPVVHVLCTCGHTRNHQADPNCTVIPDGDQDGSDDAAAGTGDTAVDAPGASDTDESDDGVIGGDRRSAWPDRPNQAAAARMPSPTNIYPQTLGRRLIPDRIVTDLLSTNGTIKLIKIRADGTFIDHTQGGRDFTPRQRLLIDLHDRHCQHPGCSTPARYCEHDHIIPYHLGGPTIIANGQLLCRFHHRWKHRNDPKPPNRNRRRTPHPSRAP